MTERKAKASARAKAKAAAGLSTALRFAQDDSISFVVWIETRTEADTSLRSG